MAFLFNLFGSKPAPPPRVPTDTIIPLFARDDTTANRAIALEYSMKFDHVLDADKLRDALSSLIQRPGWNKLGSRLRLNDKGKLEYHVPAQFTAERPPINYTHKSENIPISQHPIGAQIPRPNGTLQVFDHMQGPRPLYSRGNETEVLADWIYSDKAQLGLHITSFADATIVTVVWLHTLLDAMGLHMLLRAWLAVLDGREEHVPDFLGYDSDPIASLGEEDSSNRAKFVLEDKSIKGLGKWNFVFNYIWELFWYPAEDGCTICMPSSFFARLQAQAFRDLETLAPAEITYNMLNSAHAAPKPFLSEGDIVTAWFMRLLASCNSTANSSPSRLVNIMNVMDMRDVLRTTDPVLLPPAEEGALINNCVTSAQSLFTVQEFLSLPLGHIAARIRKDLTIQRDRAQLEAGLNLAQKNGQFALYGSGNMAFASLTNWSKAKLYDMDFSAAIVNKDGIASPGVDQKTRGKPTYIHPSAIQGGGFSIRGSGSCIGKDQEGNLWFGTIQRKEFIPNIIKAVAGLS